MSKIDARDFGNYVESCRTSLNEILRNKGIDSERSLGNAISLVDMLDGYKTSDEYVPDPYFVRMEEEWNNDPLREKNGGEYKYSYVSVIQNSYSTSFLKNTKNKLVITSDGQEILDTVNTNTTITWDTSKDIDTLSDGRKVRWIKIYSKTTGNEFPAYPTSTYKDGDSPIIFAISDMKEDALYNNQASSGSVESLAKAYFLEYLIFGENVLTIGGMGIYYMKLVKALNQNFMFKLDTSLYYRKLQRVVGNKGIITVKGAANLSEDYRDIIDFSSYIRQGELVIGSLPQQIKDNIYTRIIYPDDADTFTAKTYYVPVNQTVLRFPENIPYLSNTNEFQIISTQRKLTTLFLPKNFNISLYLNQLSNLTLESIIDISEKVKDLTEESAKTVRFNYDIKNKIDENIIQKFTNKNWTVSFIGD